MALATGSRSPDRERARPRLWMVFAAVGLGALVLALLGLAFVRVYDNQLIRQTETELIAQGVVVSSVYRELLSAKVGTGDYGLTRLVPWPFPSPAGSHLRPILPSLRASDEVLPAAREPPFSAVPAEPRAQQAGDQLSPLLIHVGRSTLAGIRVVDPQGVVVASSSSGFGTTLMARDEVQRALRGEPRSVLRRRISDSEDAPLASLSRDTGVRVTVVLPVLKEDRVWGAVVLSRTPMTFAKALYVDRWNLTATMLVLLGVVALMSLAAAALVVRPVRALVRQTRAIAASAPEGFEPVARPVVEELAELSESLAGMATALRDRNQYIRSFAANVSHEFKTPLASIQGAVELLRDSADSMTPGQRERFLSNIDADARRLTRLVQRLLELARADSLVARPARTELAPLLESLAERARAQGLSVEVGAVPAGLVLGLPAEVLEDIVWQLIINASQHGGEGVRVRIEADAAGGEGRGRVVVRDDGKGISESNRARVFDAFFTTARERGGTGLGLTIAQSMLRAFGASLELLPAEERGAAFAVVAETTPAPVSQRK
ncbi:HAMP domain-containing sensor histidine kinase [Archangium sp.]|uniref:sensor histidine kinase n=1 Tax=Archangium sp. TaxID=1872627 RepID=UPI002D72D7AA|nr:HAMP domain-containing sensor histidine kinase [Archangium sp.]HYO55478.1 HAMP domain-containing sensor histidine kinase [Archangium sp.]